MKTLITKVKELFSVPRLHEENARLMERIGELETQLKAARRNPTPAFMEVAKEFEVDWLKGKVEQKVIEDLAPFVQEDAIKFLKQAFDRCHSARNMNMYIAQVEAPTSVSIYRARFSLRSAHTEFEVYA